MHKMRIKNNYVDEIMHVNDVALFFMKGLETMVVVRRHIKQLKGRILCQFVNIWNVIT